MKKTTILTVLITITILSCKKDKQVDDPMVPEKKVSWWVIGSDTIMTDQVIKLNNGPDWFALGYDGDDGLDSAFTINVDIRGRNINDDSFLIAGPAFDSPVNLLFNNIDSVSYRVFDSSGTYLRTTTENGKIVFRLPKTYFRKLVLVPGIPTLQPSNDSTIIQGVFYEP